MIEQLPKDLIQFIGLGVIVVIGVSVIESIKVLVDRFWKNGNGSRRKRDDDWPTLLVDLLGKNGEELRKIGQDIFEIKGTLKNGLHADISEVKQVLSKCHELNLIKEYESKRKETE